MDTCINCGLRESTGVYHEGAKRGKYCINIRCLMKNSLEKVECLLCNTPWQTKGQWTRPIDYEEEKKELGAIPKEQSPLEIRTGDARLKSASALETTHHNRDQSSQPSEQESTEAHAAAQT